MDHRQLFLNPGNALRRAGVNGFFDARILCLGVNDHGHFGAFIKPEHIWAQFDAGLAAVAVLFIDDNAFGHDTLLFLWR
jgi:hypothetical protein